MSRSLHIIEPQAGNAIASYALGVVVGAPVIAVLAARLPRKYLLLSLMAVFFAGNTASALAPGYHSLVIARFLAGLPHGAYFGVASLVAASLVPLAKRGSALSRMMLGLTVATLVGVPLGSWISQLFGWNIVFAFVGAIGLLTCLLNCPFRAIPRGGCRRPSITGIGRAEEFAGVAHAAGGRHWFRRHVYCF